MVANKEENAREDLERLAELLPPSCDILVTDVRTVDAAFDAMSDLGARLERVAQAESWVARIRNAWGDPKPVVGRAAYAVWAKPWMAAGPDTFIHDVMRHWGIHNAVANLPSEDWRRPGATPAWATTRLRAFSAPTVASALRAVSLRRQAPRGA